MMIINNADQKFGYISGQYSAKPLSKADFDCTAAGPVFSDGLNKALSASKVDKIEISHDASRVSNNSQVISDTKEKILNEINQDKDQEYIDRIKQQLSVKKYAVNPVEIAKALLKESND
ncbi:flagellar biosynthesis anti-sigma factor FlgM [Caproiciproducens faecalis]|uniref:Anti-sigma-28 factor FlgM C-terminal domain-containing protein n=1 Tax=Caproiciproducens faecalis TaxID=2820301 RepID=A0ABS7DQD1_9FIRM|nr:flagellar biosynthesis anti-sigma factor FlgM [Caproiciproducens faecalis]MBW7573344.1 hypothetical protein [Caproiciproducens faecalis]